MNLANKRVLVTAAANGIGRASVLALRDAGANVIATDLNIDALQDIPGIQALQLDVTQTSAIEAISQQVGTLDVLFNCAGFVHSGALLECDDSAWQFSFDLNVTAMYRMIRAFLPGMLAAGGGSIINMASVASSVKGVPNRFAYCASKGAVIGLTRSVAADFVSQNIRCNAICPGTIVTPMVAGTTAADMDADMMGAMATHSNLKTQPCMPEDVANIALFLASDESRALTGQIIVSDFGAML